VDSVLKGGKPLAAVGRVERQGTKVMVKYSADVPVKEAMLHFTTDSGPWQKRVWHSKPAELTQGEVRGDLPADKGVVYFLTLRDERDAVVSTEHEAL